MLPIIIPAPEYDFSEWEEQVTMYQNHLDSLSREKSRLHLVPFNPNETTKEQLMAMGIPEKPATNWVNYLRKGGRFKAPEDVRKIYGLSDSISAKLTPFVRLAEDTMPQVKRVAKNRPHRKSSALKMPQLQAAVPEKIAIAVIDLNKADSVNLENLPGIGPVLAGRIVKYRKLLGGYYSVGQLKEVYGLKEEHYSKALPYLKASKEAVHPIQINFASLGELARHPYISYREAKAIVNKREKLGKIESFDMIGDIFLPEKIEKLHPYIIFAP